MVCGRHSHLIGRLLVSVAAHRKPSQSAPVETPRDDRSDELGGGAAVVVVSGICEETQTCKSHACFAGASPYKHLRLVVVNDCAKHSE